MCDQTEVSYLDGDVVWVKLGACWWPGQVVDRNKLPSEAQKELENKPLLAAVKFFQEETFEYVKNYHQIYKYNCTQKDDFIKKGLDKYRNRLKDGSAVMEKFPNDVVTAEKLTNGDPSILESNKFSPEEKPDISSLFGEKKAPKKKRDDNKSRKSISNDIRRASHAQFLQRRSDHEFRIRQQSNSLPSTPVASRLSSLYPCYLCDYTASRVNVIIYHIKSHSFTKSTKTSKSKAHAHSKNRTSHSDTPKRKYVRKEKTQPSEVKPEGSGESNSKRKLLKSVEKTNKKRKMDPRQLDQLLKDWDDDGDEDVPMEINQSIESNEEVAVVAGFSSDTDADGNSDSEDDITMKDITLDSENILKESSKLLEDANRLAQLMVEKTPTKSVPIALSPVKSYKSTDDESENKESEDTKDDKKSKFACFDFSEDDLEPAVPQSRKIPRLGSKMSLKKEMIKEFQKSEALRNEKEKEANSKSKESPMKSTRSYRSRNSSEATDEKSEGVTSDVEKDEEIVAVEVQKTLGEESEGDFNGKEVVKENENEALGKKEEVLIDSEVKELVELEHEDNVNFRKDTEQNTQPVNDEVLPRLGEKDEETKPGREAEENVPEKLDGIFPEESGEKMSGQSGVEILEEPRENVNEEKSEVQDGIDEMIVEDQIKENLEQSEEPAEKFSGEKGHVSEELSDETVEKLAQEPSVKIPKESREKFPEEPVEEISKKLTEKFSGKTALKISKKLAKRFSDETAEKIAEESVGTIVEKSAEKMIQEPEEKNVLEPEEKIIEEVEEKSIEEPEEKIPEEPAEQVMNELDEKFPEESVESMSGEFDTKVQESSTEEVFEELIETVPEYTEQFTEEPVETFLESNTEQIVEEFIPTVPEESTGEIEQEPVNTAPEECVEHIFEKHEETVEEKSTEHFLEEPTNTVPEENSEKTVEIVPEKPATISEELMETSQVEFTEVVNENASETVSEKCIEKAPEEPREVMMIEEEENFQDEPVCENSGSLAMAVGEEIVESPRVEKTIPQTPGTKKRRGRPKKNVEVEDDTKSVESDKKKVEVESDYERSSSGRLRKPNKRYADSYVSSPEQLFVNSPEHSSFISDESQSNCEGAILEECKKKNKKGLAKTLKSVESLKTAEESQSETEEKIERQSDSKSKRGVKPKNLTPSEKSCKPVIAIEDTIESSPKEYQVTDEVEVIESKITSKGLQEENVSQTTFETQTLPQEILESDKQESSNTQSIVPDVEVEKIDKLPPKKSQIKKFEQSLLSDEIEFLENSAVLQDSLVEKCQMQSTPETMNVSNDELMTTLIGDTPEVQIIVHQTKIDEKVNVVKEEEHTAKVETVVTMKTETQQPKVEKTELKVDDKKVQKVNSVSHKKEITVQETTPKIPLKPVYNFPVKREFAKSPPPLNSFQDAFLQTLKIEKKDEPNVTVPPGIQLKKLPMKQVEETKVTMLSKEVQILKTCEISSIPKAVITKHVEEVTKLPVNEETSKAGVAEKKREKPRIIQNVKLRRPFTLKTKLLDKTPSPAMKHKLPNEETQTSKLVKLDVPQTNQKVHVLQVPAKDAPRDVTTDKNVNVRSKRLEDIEFDINSMPFVFSEDVVVAQGNSEPVPPLVPTSPAHMTCSGQAVASKPLQQKEPTAPSPQLSKKKVEIPAILKNKSKARPTITSIKTICPPFSGGAKGLKYQQKTSSKVVFVQSPGNNQQMRYKLGLDSSVQMSPLRGITVGGPSSTQIVQQGNRVVILTPETGQTKTVQLKSGQKIQQNFVTQKGQLIPSLTPKNVKSELVPTSSKIQPNRVVINKSQVVSSGFPGSKSMAPKLQQQRRQQSTIASNIQGQNLISGASGVMRLTKIMESGTLMHVSVPPKPMLTPITGQRLKDLAKNSPKVPKAQPHVAQQKMLKVGSPLVRPTATLVQQQRQLAPLDRKKMLVQQSTPISSTSMLGNAQRQVSKTKCLSPAQKATAWRYNPIDSPPKMERREITVPVTAKAETPKQEKVAAQTTRQNLLNVALSSAMGDVLVDVEQSEVKAEEIPAATTTAVAKEPEKSEETKVQAEQQPQQIVALPTENSDGTQTYVLMAVDEKGQYQPLDNNAMFWENLTQQNPDGSRTLYIDPSSLGDSASLENMVLQFPSDNGSSATIQATPQEAPQSSTSSIVQPPTQDILAAALAISDFQQEIALPETPSSGLVNTELDHTSLINQTILQSTIIPPTEPISSPSVLETSLTLNQPIMTPLEVVSNLPVGGSKGGAHVVSNSPLPLKMPINANEELGISYLRDQSQIPGHSMPNIEEMMDKTQVQSTQSMPIIDDSYTDGTEYVEQVVTTEESVVPVSGNEIRGQVTASESNVVESVSLPMEIEQHDVIQGDAVTSQETQLISVEKQEAETNVSDERSVEVSTASMPSLDESCIPSDSTSETQPAEQVFELNEASHEAHALEELDKSFAEQMIKDDESRESEQAETSNQVDIQQEDDHKEPVIPEDSCCEDNVELDEPMDIEISERAIVSEEVVDPCSQAMTQPLESSMSDANQEVPTQSEVPSQSAKSDSCEEATQSLQIYDIEPPTQSFSDLPTQSFKESVQETLSPDDAMDDPNFPTQSYEVEKLEGLDENLDSDPELSEECNLPTQSNDVNVDGIGTSTFSGNSSLMNEDETASSSYVPETPEPQERDQDQESAISTSSYEIPPCEELNIGSSGVIPDTSEEHTSSRDNGILEIPTSSYTLNPDSSSSREDSAPTSSYDDQVVVDHSVSTSYEVSISMPGLDDPSSQSLVTDSGDHQNEPTSYYTSQGAEVSASYCEGSAARSEPSQSYMAPEEGASSYCAQNLSPSYYEQRHDSEASQSFYSSQHSASQSFYADQPHDLVESSVPATRHMDR